MDAVTRCAVLGRPIAHSLSPVLHGAAYAELGLDWTYDAVEVGEEDLSDFLEGLDDSWRGLSLTMPLKRTVVRLLDDADETVRLSGVANTVLLGEGRSGRNTDVPGAVAAIRERVGDEIRTAIVLGGGATAASMLFALADLSCQQVRLVVRNPDRAKETVDAAARHRRAPEIDVERLDRLEGGGAADLVISTIPASAQSAELVRRLAAPAVFDVVYDPWPTPLARAAAERGLTVVAGLDLLVHQAALQVELMTGMPAPLAAMRVAGEQALAARGSGSAG